MLLGLTLCTLLGLSLTRVAERGRYAAPYSTLGGGPDGTLGLMRLTRELHYDARPLLRELSHLHTPATLVAIGNCPTKLVRELTRPEREALLAFVDKGGLLIVAGADDYLPVEAGLYGQKRPTCEEPKANTGLFDPEAQAKSAPDDDLLGEETPEQAGKDDDAKADEDSDLLEGEHTVPYYVEAKPSGPPLTHMLPFMVTRASTVSANQETEATVLIDSESGALGMTTALGRGRVVYLGIPDALTNRNLTDSGGALFARLLRAFAPKGPVWFDEYHLGTGARRSVIRYLRDLGYGPVLFQFALVVLLAFFASTARLGRPELERVVPPQGTRSHLSALGLLYLRSKDRRGALGVLAQRALTRIAQHYRTGSVPLHELEHALSARGLLAVGGYVTRIRGHAERPFARGETLELRTREIDQDTAAAIALGDAP
jgi:hypothetical protein